MPAVVVLSMVSLTNIVQYIQYIVIILKLMVLIVKVYLGVHSMKYYKAIRYIYIYIYSIYIAWGSTVVKALVPGSNPGGVGHRDFSRGYRQNHAPWGQLSL